MPEISKSDCFQSLLASASIQAICKFNYFPPSAQGRGFILTLLYLYVKQVKVKERGREICNSRIANFVGVIALNKPFAILSLPFNSIPYRKRCEAELSSELSALCRQKVTAQALTPIDRITPMGNAKQRQQPSPHGGHRRR